MISRVLTRQTLRLSRQFSTCAIPTVASSRRTALTIAAITGAATCTYSWHNEKLAQCSAPLGSEAVMLSPKTEEATGILFPRLCNGMTLAGCGVRVKWGFVKVRSSARTFGDDSANCSGHSNCDLCWKYCMKYALMFSRLACRIFSLLRLTYC